MATWNWDSGGKGTQEYGDISCTSGGGLCNDGQVTGFDIGAATWNGDSGGKGTQEYGDISCTSGGGLCNDDQVTGFDIGATERLYSSDDIFHLFGWTLMAGRSALGGCAQTTLWW